MKRFVLAFAALLTSVSLFCQIEREFDSEYFPRNEIYIQYGTPSVLELATTLQKETSYIGKEYLGESKNYIFSGIGGLGYNFNIDKRFSVGVYFGVGYSSADLYITHIGGTTLPSPGSYALPRY